MQNTEQALDQLINQWLAHYQQHIDGFPMLEQDSQWPSPCEIKGSEKDGQVRWQPVKRETIGDFSNIEEALELTLHEDIKSFYSHYWGSDLDLNHEKGPLTLLLPWSEEDFGNLQQNIIGHVMMKRKLKQQVTIFFGLTDQEDQQISMLNETGEIWLEYVGKKPHLKLANSMAEFLSMMTIGESE